MSNVGNTLPSNWTLCKLGDVMKLRNGYAFKSKDYSGEGVPLVRISDIKNNVVNIENAAKIPVELVHDGYLIEDGDLLIAMSGATTGKTGVYKGIEKVLQNQRVGNFKIIDENVVSKGYRNYYIMSLRKAIEKAAYGGAQPNIAAKNIDEFPFPLAPLEQQKRIVAKIEELFSHIDAGIAALNKAKQLLKQYRQSVLKAAVTGELTKQWREENKDKLEPASQLLERILKERHQKWEEQQLEQFKAKGKVPKDEGWKEKYKEPFSINPKELEIADGWVLASWDQISNWVTYGFTKPMPHVDEGIPIVTGKNVIGSRIKFENTHKTPIDEYKSLSEKDRPKVGDLLITKDGTIGRAAVVSEDIEFCINQSVAVIWLRSCPINRQYLLALIESDFIQKPIMAKARGVAIQHLSITDFAKLPVPLPSLQEQEEIMQELDKKLEVIARLDRTLDEQLTKAEREKQSILASAFSGRLGAN
ncbi:MAG: restriction endonuclease subunit S [Pseudohongiellaceae bacterium]|nr:restriction endonuclease subunit S [Pseudohongiellaceae bacterium]